MRYYGFSDEIVSRKPLGSVTSNARLFHSVSNGSEVREIPALFARFAISSTFCVVDMKTRMPTPFFRSRPFSSRPGSSRFGFSGAHHHAEQRSVVFPALVDDETRRVAELDALLQIVDGQGGDNGADLQGLLRCRQINPPCMNKPRMLAVSTAPPQNAV